MLRRSALSLLLALLAGCGGDPAAELLETYVTRTARALELAPPVLTEPALTPWPRPRLRNWALEAQRTDLLQFLGLHRCDMGQLVGERNAPLGRVLVPSQRLLYEHRFLLASRRCLRRLAEQPGRAEARADLAAVVERKRRLLGKVAWNATLGSEALAGAFTVAAPALDPARAAGAGRAATGAVHVLAARIEALGRGPLDEAGWERPWEVLAASDFGGRARRSQALLTTTLDAVASLLEQRRAARPVCPQRRPTRRAEILRGVFRAVYAERVQPYLAAVHDGQRRWLGAVATLAAAQTAPPPAGFHEPFATIVGADGEGLAWRAFVAARDRHTRAWQRLLESCALAPQRPGGAVARLW